MKRREFVKKTTLASTVALVPSFLKPFEVIGKEALGHRNLVIIQLSGGNDGLNSIVPYENDIYYQNRPRIAVQKSEILKLKNDLGMNPNLAGLRNLYDEGWLSVINNVGYPNPDRSHFRSMDIWHTASDADEYLSTGWLGRYLDASCQNTYDAIEMDENLSLALKGADRKGIAFRNPYLLYNTTREPYFKKLSEATEPAELLDNNTGYLYKTLINTSSSASYIHKTSKAYSSIAKYPSFDLAKRLKTIAKFINSGLDTRVYYVPHTGYDTHANQVSRQNRLLKQFGEATEAFVRDLKHTGKLKDTLIIAFSEFGRRVKQNASGGTDHGTANNLFVIGENLKKPGLYNDLANLANLDDNGDLKYNIDFRNVYATVLSKWMQADEKLILGKGFDSMDFI